MQTLPGARDAYILEGPAQDDFCASELRRHDGQLEMYVRGIPVEILNPSTLEPHWQQHDHPAVCVIAQQYPPAIVVSFRFRSREEKVGRAIKKCYCFDFLCF